MKARYNKAVVWMTVFALMVLGACMFTGSIKADAAIPKELTVHFKSEWEGANIFYWNMNEECNNPVKWPGKTMTEEGNGWYSYSVWNADSLRFMFNFNGKQTTDFMKKTGEWWYMDGKWYEKDPSAGNATPLPTDKPTEAPKPTETPTVTPIEGSEYKDGIKINFKGTGGDVKLTYWNVRGDGYNDDGKNTVDMLAAAENWYTYVLEGADSANLIFSVNGVETKELYIPIGEWWYIDGEWQDYGPEVIPTGVPVETPTPTPGELRPSTTPTAVPIETPTPTLGEITPTEVPTQAPTQAPGGSETEPTVTKGPTATPAPAVKGKIILHLESKWETPTIYYWGINGVETDKPVAWPGEPMISEGDGWYTYTIDNAESSKVIFSNAGETQTADLSRTEGEWWRKGTKWYSMNPAFITVTPRPTSTPKPTRGPTATPVPIERTDFRDETIYFVMTTRFYDGDSSNNVHCWDDAQAGNPDTDPAWRGDFKGLIERLDYIKALGFTAIWITPVVENTSGYDYHGYHASDFSKVDPRYESEGVTYTDLINAVHEKGMKIVQDVVLNHTGNFGEANLIPMFEKTGDLGTPECLVPLADSGLPEDYNELLPGQQYDARLALMKNTDGVDHDTENLYHHYGNFNWDEYNSQLAQIAGDCVDLNTENPIVYNYLIDTYTQYINMGVDAFRVDTTKHISRLTFNETFNPAFKAAGGENFYMFGEVCARDRNVWYRNTPGLSTPFYTWKESKDYGWSDTDQEHNVALTETHFIDNSDPATQPTTDNALLRGNDYHEPDYSMKSGLDVIDFPMHWNFKQASDAFGVAVGGDKYYNDATWNVTYVDSHDYAPDTAPEFERFNQPQDTWAENLSLMFTFRGIPCIYYGSEVEFMKGAPIDKGPKMALSETGRAYFGDHLKGTITTTDFGEYTATGAIAETLNYPLSLHIQRLNKIRAAIPALRKGQYSTEGVSGGMAFKRRYTNAEEGVDSFVCVAVTNGATFSGIPNGTYTDAVTGDVQNVSNGTLTIEASGKGNLRAYVLDTELTKAPGKVGTDGTYLK